MTYRDTPPVEPLLLTLGLNLLALDPKKGELLWKLALPLTADRLFRDGNRLLLLTGKSVLVVDLTTGKPIGGVELPFTASTGLLHEGFLYLAGGGAACIDPQGQLLWVTTQPAMTELWSFDFSVICKNSEDRELWRLGSSLSGQPGICLGDLIAQPDHQG